MSTKRGLARNPLELVLGRSRAEPRDDAREHVFSEPEAKADAMPEHVAESEVDDVVAQKLEAPKPPRKQQRVVRRRPRLVAEQEMVQSPEAVRVGTIKRPYLRIDGIAMRQVSLSLPVDLMQHANICAIKQGLRSNEIVQLALENYLRDFGE